MRVRIVSSSTPCFFARRLTTPRASVLSWRSSKGILRKNGTTPTVRAGVRKQYNLAEATIDAFAKVINESAAKPAGALTETAPQARHERILYEAAQNLLDGAERAEADLAGASIQDLEAYATLGIGARAFAR